VEEVSQMKSARDMTPQETSKLVSDNIAFQKEWSLSHPESNLSKALGGGINVAVFQMIIIPISIIIGLVYFVYRRKK